LTLEASNSPSIIFKHYRELTTEEQAEKWFGIMPKEGSGKRLLAMTIRAFLLSAFQFSALQLLPKISPFPLSRPAPQCILRLR